jgi:glycosyltransferase involved in cell wall biosynthesis
MTPVRFTVMIPTRNRPALFARALASVLGQEGAAFEVVVVDDGSAEIHTAAYGATIGADDPKVRFVRLERRPKGHGPSYALNASAQVARGDYLCFLDDDDTWTDSGHLRRAAAVIAGSGEPDLYMADQAAWVGDAPMTQPVWIEDLLDRVPELPGPDADGSYAVTLPALLRAHGACHLNTLIIRRAFYEEIGGLDDGLRYANDWEFYLRAIDRARAIRYWPGIVARHNVPVADARVNASTQFTRAERLLIHLQVADRVFQQAGHAELRRHVLRQKTYTLQHLALHHSQSGRHGAASHFARQALAIRPDLRWLATTMRLSLRSLIGSRSNS